MVDNVEWKLSVLGFLGLPCSSGTGIVQLGGRFRGRTYSDTPRPKRRLPQYRPQIFAESPGNSPALLGKIEWGGFQKGGGSCKNRCVLKPDIAIASKVPISSKNSLAITRKRSYSTIAKPPFLEPQTLQLFT